jgi:hypothetical protein
MTVPQFEDLSLTVGITTLCTFMLFIVYDLAKQSKAGRLGTFVLFIALGLGIVGFATKAVIEALVHV